MTDTVALAIIVAAGALLTTALNGWLLRRSKREDWARQDQVAEKTAEVARLLVESDARAVKANTVMGGQLRQIHVLVNATLSASIAEQLHAREQQLVLLREVVQLQRGAGREPSPDTVDAVAKVEARIAELRVQVEDRARQTEIADAQRIPRAA